MLTLAVVVIALALLPAAWRTLRGALYLVDDVLDLALAPWGVQAAAALVLMGLVVGCMMLARACGLTTPRGF